MKSKFSFLSLLLLVLISTQTSFATEPTIEELRSRGPAGLQALMAQPAGVPNWQGPYLKKAVPLDPWSHPYIYKRLPSLKDIELSSLGADGKPGGDGEARDVFLADKD